MHPTGDAPAPASADGPATAGGDANRGDADHGDADRTGTSGTGTSGAGPGASPEPPATRELRPDGPLDLRLTLMMVRHGPADPSLRIRQDGTVWHALRTPDGPATVLLRAGPGRVAASAWGPGAEHALAGLPDLLGARDDVRTFDPSGHAAIAAAHHRLRGLRIPRTGDVLGALVPAVLEQRVVTVDAHDAWRRLLLQHGTTPPGPAPAGMRVPPDAHGWRRIPSWDWRRAGVDDRRASTVLRAAAVAGRLQEAVDRDPAELRRRLLTVPGIGVWTVAETTRRALGDADAVSVGDLHLPRLVGDAVAGRRVEQDEVLDVLAPWAPHRARVVRLLELVERSTRGARTRPRPRRAVRPA